MRRLTVIALLTIALHLVAMGVYLRNVLGGEIDYHILPAEMFGVPQALAERGIKPLYYGVGNTGWDGQFYYYIANDLFARGDASQHIDAPAYRYQRPGLSLFAKLISVLAFRDWVSPAFYYASYIMLVFFGTLAAGAVLRHYGVNPAWGLLWSIGVGTQLTVINGLPDAAADAFLLVSIAFLLKTWRLAATMALSFCILSREIYVVFPLLLGLLSLVDCVRRNSAGTRLRSVVAWSISKDCFLFGVPVAIFLGWQIFIRLRFGVAPSEQAHGVLGWPLLAWSRYFISGLRGHLLLGTGGAKREAISLFFFISILLTALACVLTSVVTYWRNNDVIGQAIAAITGIFAVAYFFFGPTVMMHYTGYMKAATIFFFFIPLLLGTNLKSERELHLSPRPQPRWRIENVWHVGAKTIAVLAFVYTNAYFWTDRMMTKQDVLVNRYANRITTVGEANCLHSFKTELRIVSWHDAPFAQTFFNKWFPPDRASLVWIEVTNRTGQYFSTLMGKGGVNISYQWLSSDGKNVVMDGIRTAMVQGLEDGEAGRFPVVVKYPRKSGEYILRFSPVQELCAWFYVLSPVSSADEKVTIQ